MGGDSIGERKAQHLEICVDDTNYRVEGGKTLLGELRFVHRALPEINESEIDLQTQFLGSTISMPVFISSMTGGSAEGYRMNKLLAQVAQETGIPVGMGSIRILFRKPEVMDHFHLKKIARDVPVFANIGGVQLIASDEIARLAELIKTLEVDAIAVHLNPGQELAQPEGDRDFRGVADGIARLCDQSPVPVIVKETGFGIDPTDAARLVAAGATYVDVAGSGGTNWVTVEGYRLPEQDRLVTEEFADWGIPTAVALDATRAMEGKILASGGLRTGMDVAKCVALGAVAGGLALPFAREVSRDGLEGGLKFAERLRRVIRTTMLLGGCRTVQELRQAPLLKSPAFLSQTEQLTALRGN